VLEYIETKQTQGKKINRRGKWQSEWWCHKELWNEYAIYSIFESVLCWLATLRPRLVIFH